MSTQTEPQESNTLPPPKKVMRPVQTVTSQEGTPTWEIANLFPQQGHWTEAAYLSLDTNHLIEFCDGFLEFLPMPTMFHQFLVRFFYHQLNQLVESRSLGFTLFAPLRVRTVEDHIREPDVVFLKHERVQNLREPPQGADLVAEVVSPGTESRARDLEEKREEYAQAGIEEYWIIDPEARVVRVLTLKGPEYEVHGEFSPGQTATSLLIPDFKIVVADLFAAGQPDGNST